MIDAASNKTIGSWNGCDLVIEGPEVSPIHAQVQISADGFLTVIDAGSDHGTFLNRNQQWIRVMKVEPGSQDRIRCGTVEITPDKLIALFGERVRVRLRDSQAMRIPQRVAERLAAAERRAALERPRRNPETGNIEEDPR